MKKYIGFLIALGILVFGASHALASSSINVLSPNGGENFIQNEDNSIVFTYSAPVNEFVQIGLVDSSAKNSSDLVGNPYLLKGWISAPGGPGGISPFETTFNWGAVEVCDLGFLTCWPVSPGKYKILVQMKDSMGNLSLLPSATNWDVSDSYFTISSSTDCDSNDEPSYNVLYPNGGEIFTAGEQITINWESCNISTSEYNTDIYLKNTSTRKITYLTNESIKNDGAETFNLAADFIPGKYKAYVGTSAGGWGQSFNPFTINSPGSNSIVTDPTPRIMYWYGKVNQHVDSNGVWQSDPDGVSGANLDMLTYCKKWYPNTTDIEEYKLETINTWRERGNINAWTSTKMSYKCLQGETDSEITVLSPNGGEKWIKGTEQKIKWKSLVATCQGGDLCSPNVGIFDITLVPKITCPAGTACMPPPYTIAKNVNNYYYLWQVGKNLDQVSNIPDGNYIINICQSGTNICDWSDKPFEIKSSNVVTCPSGCTCTGDTISCPVEPWPVDMKCLPGYKYSPITGEACPVTISDDGCLPGYKYNPITGEKCIVALKQCTSSEGAMIECATQTGLSTALQRVLKIGVKGEDVKVLQTFLGINADGSYGPITKQKVMEWQAKNGLNPDGAFGPMSQQKAGLVE